jgi:hypothetical protein
VLSLSPDETALVGYLRDANVGVLAHAQRRNQRARVRLLGDDDDDDDNDDDAHEWEDLQRETFRHVDVVVYATNDSMLSVIHQSLNQSCTTQWPGAGRLARGARRRDAARHATAHIIPQQRGRIEAGECDDVAVCVIVAVAQSVAASLPTARPFAMRMSVTPPTRAGDLDAYAIASLSGSQVGVLLNAL